MFNLQQELSIFLTVRERQKAERESGLVPVTERKARRPLSLGRLLAASKVWSARQVRQAKADQAL